MEARGIGTGGGDWSLSRAGVHNANKVHANVTSFMLRILIDYAFLR